MLSAFENFYTTGVSLKRLEDGEHRATLKSHEFVPGKCAGGKDDSYVRLNLQLEDRVINDNRFEQGFTIFINQIKAQLGISDQTISVPQLLEILRARPFSIWISRSLGRSEATGKTTTYTNVNYMPPTNVATATVITVGNEDAPL